MVKAKYIVILYDSTHDSFVDTFIEEQHFL